MRKEEIRGLVVYLVLILTAVIVGLTVVKPTLESYPPKISSLGFIIIVLVVAYLFNVIALELLHVIGALFGGYKVTSINILGLCLYKAKDKWKLGFRDFNGVSGETKIAPNKEKLNPSLISWLPLFGYAAELAVCVIVISIIKSQASPTSPWLVPGATIMLLVASMLTVYNLVPLKLDTLTDGYKIRLFTKEINVKAYNEMLKVQEKRRLGENIEKVPVFSEITEYTAEINILAMYKYLEEENYSEAEKVIDQLLENKKILNVIVFNRLIAQKLYLAILTQPLENAKKLYEQICPIEIRRFMANDNSMASIRAYILIAGMIEGSESEVAYAKSKVEKAKKKALESEINAEEKLLEKALDYVYNNHPKWSKENAAE